MQEQAEYQGAKTPNIVAIGMPPFYLVAWHLWPEFVLYRCCTGVLFDKSPEWCKFWLDWTLGELLSRRYWCRVRIMPFVALEKLHLLFDGYRKPIKLGGQDLLLLQENGKTLLIKNQCPHAAAPLTRASVGNNSLRCPMHGIEFDLTTGQSRSPACAQALQFLPLIYEGNTVGVELR